MKRIPQDMLTGFIHSTKRYGDLKIMKYTSSKSVDVEFIETNYKCNTDSDSIRKGAVKDRMAISVYGFGIVGVGPHKVSIKREATHAYKCWVGMIKRCYSDEFQKRNPSYKGCSVSEEWRNFQNFADWFIDNYPRDGLKYEIDKDKIAKGNKIYGPDFCCFLTKRENMAVSFAKNYLMINPKGRLIKIKNLKQFCEIEGLDYKSIHRVASGKRASHKGWKLPNN